MPLSKLVRREVRSRPGRTLLTLFSVVIGVAAVVAVTLATQSTKQAFDDMYKSMAGKAALEVAAPAGVTIDEALVPQIAAAPGVAAAAPLIQRRSVLYAGPKKAQLMVLGIDPALDGAIHDFHIEKGESLDKAPGVLLSVPIAESLNISVGDRVRLLTRSGRMPTRVTGLYLSGGTSTTAQGAVLLLPLRSAQLWFKAPRKVDSIQVVLKEDASVEEATAAIAKLLPKPLTVRPPAGRSAMAEETALSTEQGLKMARAFSLLVAAFIIANTFLISVTQRRRQFGILRAIGATRSQVARLVLSQAVTLGLAGAVLGSLVGVLAARFLAQAMGSLYETPMPKLKLTPLPFAWGTLFGVGVSLIGAALPARRAANLSPLEAIRDVSATEFGAASQMLVRLGGVISAFSSLVLGLSIAGIINESSAVWSSVLLLVGIVLLLPLGLGPLSRGVAAALPASLRVEAKLAGRHLLSHRSRTTLTVGVVFVAISTGIGLASAVIDNVADVKEWYRKSIVADFFIRATSLDMATGTAADLPDEVGKDLRGVAGVQNIDAIRFVSAKSAGQQVIIVVRNFDDPELMDFDMVAGDETTIRDRLVAGEAVVGSVLAQRANLKPGDELPLETEAGVKKFRVAAVVNDYQAGGLTVYLERAAAQRLLGVGGVDAYTVRVDHERIDQVRDDLHELCGKYGLLLQSFSDIQRKIDGMMAGVVAGLWAMVALALLVAAFGVANTLTMSVLEQTYELGLMRILASTRNQVRMLIFTQAAMIGLLALVPGVLAGVAVAYLIHLATMPVIGHPVQFALHPWLMLGGLAAGLAVVLLAAWLPAERAARIEIPATLRLR